jgi:hypothetical protein
MSSSETSFAGRAFLRDFFLSLIREVHAGLALKLFLAGFLIFHMYMCAAPDPCTGHSPDVQSLRQLAGQAT